MGAPALGYEPVVFAKEINEAGYVVDGITTPNGKNRTPSSKIPRGSLQRN
jgi:hypothetical protein